MFAFEDGEMIYGLNIHLKQYLFQFIIGNQHVR